MNNGKEIPYGYCHCGCGGKTNVAKNSDKRLGHVKVKGEPLRFCYGHWSIKNHKCNICKINEKKKYYSNGKLIKMAYCAKCFNKYCQEREETKRKDAPIKLNICPVCGKEFQGICSDKKYCSDRCHQKYYNQKYKYKLNKQRMVNYYKGKSTAIYYNTCLICLNEFISRFNKQYCSAKCRAARNRCKLADHYLRGQLTVCSSLNAKDIPDEIVELQRLKIKLVRMVWKTKLKGESYDEHAGNSGSSEQCGEGFTGGQHHCG